MTTPGAWTKLFNTDEFPWAISDSLIERASHAARTSSTWICKHMRPFGAVPTSPDIEREYVRDLADQFRYSFLPVHDMQLFPDRPVDFNGAKQEGIFLRSPIDPVLSIAIGVTSETARKNMPSSSSRDAVTARRVQVAIHETVHGLNKVKPYPHKQNESVGVMQQMMQAVCFRSDKASRQSALSYGQIRQNLEERYAEGTSWLYMLSNYKGDLQDFMVGLRDYTATKYALSHNFLTTLRPVLENFVQHPVKGMDIVQCRSWAEQIIGRQTGIAEEQQVMSYAHWGYFDKAVHKCDDPQPPPRKLQSIVQHAIDTRLRPFIAPDGSRL